MALHDGGNVLAESTTIDARRHTELLAPAIVEVLGAAGVDGWDLTAIAVASVCWAAYDVDGRRTDGPL